MFTKPTKVALACATTFATLSVAQAQANNTMQPVVIYGARFADESNKALPQNTVISSEDILKSGMTNIPEILQKIGGVPTKPNLYGTQDLSYDLRGYGVNSDQNLVVVIDGVRISENEQAVAKLSLIPVESIDQIEIMRGVNSVFYGEGATSGAIYVKTKSSDVDRAVVSAGVGNNSTREGTAYLSKSIDKVSVATYARVHESDNFRNRNKVLNKSGGLDIATAVDGATKLGIKFFADEQSTELPGAISRANFYINQKQARYPFDSATYLGKTVSAFFDKKISSDLELRLDVSRREADRSSVNWTNNTGPSSGTLYDYSSDVNSVNPRLKFINFAGFKNDLTLGADLSNWDYTYKTGSTNERAKQKNRALYVRDDIHFSSLQRVVLGYRSEKFTKSTFDPAAGSQGFDRNLDAYEFQYIKGLSSNLNAYGKLGTGYRIPNVDDNRNTYWNSLPYPASLEPQRSKDYELGVNGVDKNMRYGIRFFHSLISNEIIYSENDSRNINLSPTKRHGVELEFAADVNSATNIYGSFQLIKAQFRDGLNAGQRIPLVPNYTARLGMDYKLNAQQKIGVISRYVASQKSDGDFDATAIRIPGYAITDISYSAQYKNWLWTAYASNIFDKKYYSWANIWGSVYPDAGLSLKIVGRYTFK